MARHCVEIEMAGGVKEETFSLRDKAGGNAAISVGCRMRCRWFLADAVGDVSNSQSLGRKGRASPRPIRHGGGDERDRRCSVAVTEIRWCSSLLFQAMRNKMGSGERRRGGGFGSSSSAGRAKSSPNYELP